LFTALKNNTKLEALSLTNVGLTDRTALMLAEAVEKNSTLRVLNIETNFISPQVVVVVAKALLQNMSVEEFRASNQVSRERRWGVVKILITSHHLMRFSHLARDHR
jgi:tropomodulin